jgi:shikimate dehydrogenase
MALNSGIGVLSWVARNSALANAALVVNTTTLGMSGQPALEIDLGVLPAAASVFDCVYSPLETALLAQARARGLVAIDGLGMLIHQARAGFTAWFGVEPELDGGLRRFLAEGL